jgi:hypothetical protein
MLLPVYNRVASGFKGEATRASCREVRISVRHEFCRPFGTGLNLTLSSEGSRMGTGSRLTCRIEIVFTGCPVRKQFCYFHCIAATQVGENVRNSSAASNAKQAQFPCVSDTSMSNAKSA